MLDRFHVEPDAGKHGSSRRQLAGFLRLYCPLAASSVAAVTGVCVQPDAGAT